MYQIKCDDYILYDPRDEELVLLNPKCKLEVNTVGEASFTILQNHPYYDKLQKLKSIFEIRQDEQVIFRGRMTNNSRDFYNQLDVDLEGVLGFTNDSIIEPFTFPDDFTGTASENTVADFLGWILGKHNAQVQSFQQLKLGTVTVADPNNYITRASDTYLSTWDVLKTRLFDSSLGGYLVIRYESDGNYVDYVNGFELTNVQQINFGENLLDMTDETDASETYSAILPQGAEVETDDGETYRVTLESLPNGALTDDLVKSGKFIYSKSAVEQYGWICVPVDDATWEDVTDAANLQTKAMAYMTGTAMLLSSTITIKAVDLNFTDDEIQSFRIYRNIIFNSPVHGIVNASYPLTKLDIDILNPQNTTIVIGNTIRTLTDVSSKNHSDAIERVEQVAQLATNVEQSVTETVQQQMITQETAVTATCSEMILAALEQYVETGDYTEFKEAVETQLKILSDEISMNFTTNSEAITNVNGDLQAKFTQLYKFITFSGDTAITIGSGDSTITLEIDNEKGIVFKKNGVQFGLWDGVDFYTGNIIVNVDERAQFGNFAFIPRSDGSLMFLKVGG